MKTVRKISTGEVVKDVPKTVLEQPSDEKTLSLPASEERKKEELSFNLKNAQEKMPATPNSNQNASKSASEDSIGELRQLSGSQ